MTQLIICGLFLGVVAFGIVDFLCVLFDQPWAKWWEGRQTRKEMRKLLKKAKSSPTSEGGNVASFT